MKRAFVIIGLLLALLAAPCVSYAAEHGGGEGGAKAKEGEAKKGEGGEKKPKKKEDAATITGGMTDNDPIYLNLPAITMPVINKYGAQQVISMIINVRVSERAAAEAMQANMPKLRDSLFQVLYTGFSDGSLRNDNAVDLAGVKAIVIQTINALYQKDYATDVLIQAMAQRRL
ncbi:MAG: hypothetical protein WC612_06055 [Bdellovibrionales bacterium]|jgi:flagellar basal body-associated protein FliL